MQTFPPPSRSGPALAVLIVMMMAVLSIKLSGATARAVWRSTNTSWLPSEQVGTTQWVDLILEVDASGLHRYEFDLLLDLGAVILMGEVVESPPAPLDRTSGGIFINPPFIIQNFQAEAPSLDVSLAGPTRVVVGSFQVMVTEESDAAVIDPLMDIYVDGAQASPTVETVGAMVGTAPPVLGEVDYSYELVASSELAVFDSFLQGGSLGANRRVALLAGTSLGSQKVILYENGRLKAIADNDRQFNRFSSPRINSDGRVTFWAADGGKTSDLMFAHDQGLYKYDRFLTEFLSVNPAAVRLVGFNALGESPIVNDNDEVVFGSNYYDLHVEEGKTSSIPFDTLHWKDLSAPGSEPVELYRGRDPEGFVNRPAAYNGLEPPYGFNRSGQVLFFAYTDGTFPGGRGELLLGGVDEGQPIEPVLIASETAGIYEDISFSQLNEDGTVIFHALVNGDSDYSILRWKEGNVETILAADNPFGIRYQESLGFVSRNDRVVFADSISSLFMWSPGAGISHIFTLAQGPNPGDILSDADEVPIRPPEVTSGWLQNLIGVDDLGRIALNIEWEDGIQTVLLATPLKSLQAPPALSKLKFDGREFRMSFVGVPGQQMRLEGSTDFIKWTPIQTFTTGDGPMLLSDPDAADVGSKFYRVAPVDP